MKVFPGPVVILKITSRDGSGRCSNFLHRLLCAIYRASRRRYAKKIAGYVRDSIQRQDSESSSCRPSERPRLPFIIAGIIHLSQLEISICIRVLSGVRLNRTVDDDDGPSRITVRILIMLRRITNRSEINGLPCLPVPPRHPAVVMR